MTTFCIVTPVCNGVQFINMAITHIVSQTGDFRIRYHIQDGGSTDGTLECIKKWEKMLASGSPIIQCRGLEFSWASEKDDGMYDAINRGFAKMDIGDDDLMSWCNADDMYLPGVFSTLTRLITENPGVAYIAGDWRFFERGRVFEYTPIRGPYPQEVMQNYCCDGPMWTQPPQPSIFWKGALWRKAGPLNSELHYAGDYEYWRRLSLHAPCVYLPLSISMCLRHDKQLAKQRPEPEALTFYMLEKENIAPTEQRRAFMRQFWKKRSLPPYAYEAEITDNGYRVKRVRCWPCFWGKTWREYLKRRHRYTKYLIRTGWQKASQKIKNFCNLK